MFGHVAGVPWEQAAEDPLHHLFLASMHASMHPTPCRPLTHGTSSITPVHMHASMSTQLAYYPRHPLLESSIHPPLRARLDLPMQVPSSKLRQRHGIAQQHAAARQGRVLQLLTTARLKARPMKTCMYIYASGLHTWQLLSYVFDNYICQLHHGAYVQRLSSLGILATQLQNLCSCEIMYL